MSKQKMTILDFQKYKDEGRKFAYCTAYDYTTASIVNESEIEIILVGDSLGMVMLGYDSTVGVTMEDMIHHIRPVVKGAPNTFIVGDMPFGSYQESPEQAIRNACRLLAETNCDCVKLEGGANMAPTIKRMTDVGIPVMGHIGLTPQSATNLGGFKMQGGTPEGAKKLIQDALALEAAGVFSIVLECVPNCVGKAISEAVHVPVLGIGAGPRTCWICTAISSRNLSSSLPIFAGKWSPDSTSSMPRPSAAHSPARNFAIIRKLRSRLWSEDG